MALKVRRPNPGTMKKYGYTIPMWRELLKSQEGVCFICGIVPPSRILCFDHEHVRGWRKMPPEQRRLYVRGLCCVYDNFRLLRKGVTLAKARRVVAYLERYEARSERPGVDVS